MNASPSSQPTSLPVRTLPRPWIARRSGRYALTVRHRQLLAFRTSGSEAWLVRRVHQVNAADVSDQRRPDQRAAAVTLQIGACIGEDRRGVGEQRDGLGGATLLHTGARSRQWRAAWPASRMASDRLSNVAFTVELMAPSVSLRVLSGSITLAPSPPVVAKIDNAAHARRAGRRSGRDELHPMQEAGRRGQQAPRIHHLRVVPGVGHHVQRRRSAVSRRTGYAILDGVRSDPGNETRDALEIHPFSGSGRHLQQQRKAVLGSLHRQQWVTYPTQDISEAGWVRLPERSIRSSAQTSFPSATTSIPQRVANAATSCRPRPPATPGSAAHGRRLQAGVAK